MRALWGSIFVSSLFSWKESVVLYLQVMSDHPIFLDIDYLLDPCDPHFLRRCVEDFMDTRMHFFNSISLEICRIQNGSSSCKLKKSITGGGDCHRKFYNSILMLGGQSNEIRYCDLTCWYILTNSIVKFPTFTAKFHIKVYSHMPKNKGYNRY